MCCCIYFCKEFCLKLYCIPTVLQKSNIFIGLTPCWFYCFVSMRNTVCILLEVSLSSIKLKCWAKYQGKPWNSLCFLIKCQANFLPPYPASTDSDWNYILFSQIWEAWFKKNKTKTTAKKPTTITKTNR